MNNVQDLQREVDELKSKLETAQKKLAGCKGDPWKAVTPQNGDKFYYLDAFGEVDWAHWAGRLDLHQKMLKIGNVYKTKEDAEFEAERLKVMAGLKLFAKKFELDELNWVFYYDCSDDEVTIFTMEDIQDGSLIFESKEKVLEAIEFVGEERIKKYYLGVTD